MKLYCDFDGTITTVDATDYVLSKLADPAWEFIEQDWKAGRIGSAECMAQQVALIRATPETLDTTLDAIPLDPHFVDFIAFCKARAIDVTIISDGVDYFIRRILRRVGLQDIPVIANRLVISESGYALFSPYADAACASAAGVCKCRMVEAATAPRIYIGDGRSDFCVSDKPEIVFAKGTLATYCDQHGIDCYRFDNFSDVIVALEPLIAAGLPRAAAVPTF